MTKKKCVRFNGKLVGLVGECISFPQKMSQRIYLHTVGCLVNLRWNHQLDLFFDPIFQAAISSPPKEDPPVPAATEVVAESEAAA